MAGQWIVAYHGDMTLNVSAVGPFRAKWRAERAADRLRRAADAAGGTDPGRIPHVVPLRSVVEAAAQLSRRA